jgi:hypothetical protein
LQAAGRRDGTPLLLREARSFSDEVIRFLVFSPTERLRKKAKRRSEGLGEKRPNPGCFWFAMAEDFLGDWRRKKLHSGQFGLGMAKKRRTRS